ncbi:MAG: MEDS domain-containing protein [Pseudomonadota bacterium]
MAGFDTFPFTVRESTYTHACMIFDDIDCYRRIASEFVLEGLNENEKCIMVTGSYKQTMIAEDFAEAGVTLNDYLGNGKLSIIDADEFPSENRRFEPERVIDMWKVATDRAIAQGFKAFRLVCEPVFSLGRPEMFAERVNYQTFISEGLVPHYPFKYLLVFDRTLYPNEIIKKAISSNPILFYNDKLYTENIYFIPPEVHSKKSMVPDEIDAWLTNVEKNSENVRSLQAALTYISRSIRKQL